jgi:hypothetical protein
MGVSTLLTVLVAVTATTIGKPGSSPVAFLDEVTVEAPLGAEGAEPNSALAAVSERSEAADPLPPPEPRLMGILLPFPQDDGMTISTFNRSTPSSETPTSTEATSSSTAPKAASPPSTQPPQPTTPPSPTPAPGTASGPLRISNQSNLVLEGLSISNPNGPCVEIVGSSNVTIQNSTIGPCGSWAVFIDRSSGITVSGNTIKTQSSKGGVYALSSTTIKVLGNGISSSGRNPVQFDKVTGSGNRIESNTIVSNAAEDMISVYKSGGTSGSWLTVTGNTVKSNTGQSKSGSGIMVGDAGGQYILVQGNSLTDPGQAGIGVAGGSNIRVLGNSVNSAQFPWSNVGIYVWNQAGSCGAIEVRGNTVSWVNSSGQSNPAWDGGGCGAVAGWSENSW